MKKVFSLALAFSALQSFAQVQINVGFEASESYNAALLVSGGVGQQGWKQFPGSPDVTTGLVQTLQPKTGTRSLLADANLIAQEAYWYKPVNYNYSTGTNKVVKVTWSLHPVSPSGAATLTNTSIFGCLGYDSMGNLMNGLYFDNFDRTIWYYNTVGQSWALTTSTRLRDQYTTYGFTLNFADGVTRYEVNGALLPESSGIATNNGTFGDADLYCGVAATDRAYFDDAKVEVFPVGALEGTVNLEEFIGNPATRPVTIEIRNPGTTLALDTKVVTLDANMRFVTSTTQRGVKDIAIKGYNQLRTVIPNVNIIGNGVYGLSAFCRAGDIDGDNTVSILDYSVLSDYFDKSDFDSDWNTVGGNGYKPSDADLDGDGTVSILDYSYLSSNFDQNGQD